MRFSPRTLLTTVLLALAACAAAPAAGHASPRQASLFEAPNELLSDQTRTATLDQIQGFGVSNVRQIVYWQRFAPQPNSRRRPSFDAADSNAYPAGTWTQLDNLVNEATARGMQVQLTLSGPVPKWATKRKRDHVTSPSVKEFAKWVKAVGSRYGDQVSTWSLWNEPNSAVFLKPRGLAAAKVYRSLYIAGAKALRSVASNRHDRILLGETAPRGGRNQSAPLAFLRRMLCLNSRYQRTAKCSKLDTQGYAHHAYTTRTGPRFRPPADDVTIGVLGRLTKALDRAARARAVPKRLKLYLTEFGIQSYPDRVSGVPQSVQPAYYAIAEHIAYLNPRVVQFSQYLMRDDRSRGGFQTGLETYTGKRKPAYRAYPLPLAVEQSGSRDLLWGLVRPDRHRTTVTIQSRRGGKGRWTTLRRVPTGSTGVYALSTRHRKGTQYRVRWGSLTGPGITAR
jgi:hypothetical protein